MRFIKCPRCELNYIQEGEGYCPVCKREMKGERQEELYELCSICNENPCMPGKDVCYECYKEMTQQDALHNGGSDDEEDRGDREVDIDIDEVADIENIDIDEIQDDDDDDDIPPEIGNQISLEEEQSKEDEDDEEDMDE